MEERLQKILARAGYGSRRSSEDVIAAGRVTVNGRVAELGAKADPRKDDVRVDGRSIRAPEPSVYVALHKPRGVLSDEGEPGGHRRTIFELVPIKGHLFPVGRLDLDSEGLILLTDDGELANRLTHPRYEHPKEYHVLVEGRPEPQTLESWREGLFLEGRRTAPAEVTMLRVSGAQTWLRIVLREGRKRQIRRIAAILGHPVRRLIRMRIGPVELGDLRPGQWRRLTGVEQRALRELTQRPPRRRR